MTGARVPNLFIIGAAKCGTTAMSHWLAAHPRIYMSEQAGVKEPRYFATDMRSSQSRYTTWHDYQELFEAAPAQVEYIGEASVLYVFSKAAIANILHASPSARLIVMVRNPVDMVCSLHNQILKNRQENVFDFERAWRLQTDRRRGKRLPAGCYSPHVLQYGDRARLGSQIQRLFQQAPREQIHVVVYDDLQANPRKAYADALDFLDLDYRDIALTRANVRTRIRSRAVHATLRHAKAIRTRLGIPGGWGIDKRITKLNSQPTTQHALRPAFRRELADYFRDDVTLLSDLLERDLGHWVDDGND
jgi:hypothetical protein